MHMIIVSNSIGDVIRSYKWFAVDLQVGICPKYFDDIFWFWKVKVVLKFW
jgi:hypothetical protein